MTIVPLGAARYNSFKKIFNRSTTSSTDQLPALPLALPPIDDIQIELSEIFLSAELTPAFYNDLTECAAALPTPANIVDALAPGTPLPRARKALRAGMHLLLGRPSRPQAGSIDLARSSATDLDAAGLVPALTAHLDTLLRDHTAATHQAFEALSGGGRSVPVPTVSTASFCHAGDALALTAMCALHTMPGITAIATGAGAGSRGLLQVLMDFAIHTSAASSGLAPAVRVAAAVRAVLAAVLPSAPRPPPLAPAPSLHPRVPRRLPPARVTGPHLADEPANVPPSVLHGEAAALWSGSEDLASLRRAGEGRGRGDQGASDGSSYSEEEQEESEEGYSEPPSSLSSDGYVDADSGEDRTVGGGDPSQPPAAAPDGAVLRELYRPKTTFSDIRNFIQYCVVLYIGAEHRFCARAGGDVGEVCGCGACPTSVASPFGDAFCLLTGDGTPTATRINPLQTRCVQDTLNYLAECDPCGDPALARRRLEGLVNTALALVARVHAAGKAPSGGNDGAIMDAVGQYLNHIETYGDAVCVCGQADASTRWGLCDCCRPLADRTTFRGTARSCPPYTPHTAAPRPGPAGGWDMCYTSFGSLFPVMIVVFLRLHLLAAKALAGQGEVAQALTNEAGMLGAPERCVGVADAGNQVSTGMLASREAYFSAHILEHVLSAASLYGGPIGSHLAQTLADANGLLVLLILPSTRLPTLVACGVDDRAPDPLPLTPAEVAFNAAQSVELAAPDGLSTSVLTQGLSRRAARTLRACVGVLDVVTRNAPRRTDALARAKGTGVIRRVLAVENGEIQILAASIITSLLYSASVRRPKNQFPAMLLPMFRHAPGHSVFTGWAPAHEHSSAATASQARQYAAAHYGEWATGAVFGASLDNQILVYPGIVSGTKLTQAEYAEAMRDPSSLPAMKVGVVLRQRWQRTKQ